MFKRYCALTLALLLLTLTACTKQDGAQQGDARALSLVATTYPIYLFLSEVTHNVEGVRVSALINQNVSCLHDYTVTMQDMKTLESADALYFNSGGLDDFMSSSLRTANPDARATALNLGIALIEITESDHIHKQGEVHELDPHYWLDPLRAAQMVDTLAQDLMALDAANAALYRSNADAAMEKLAAAHADLTTRLAPLSTRSVITFHDGFSYFAESFDLEIILAVEEAENQAASAQVIATTMSLIAEFSLPAIFTEELSSDATAQAIAAESGVAVYPLSLLMSGETQDAGIDTYISAMGRNIDTLLEAYT